VTTAEARSLIVNDESFIYSKRFNYDLKELEERYPDGCPDRVTAAVLMITEDDVESHYQRIVRILRNTMGVRDE
jgi:hypothetical protein